MIIQRGDDWITLENAQGKTFRINEFVAQVDENISYDDAANYFLATAKNASVTVGEEAEIWLDGSLDGSHGKSFIGNIKTLDATTFDGKNTLAGNALDNVISAGAGDASLWGAATVMIYSSSAMLIIFSSTRAATILFKARTTATPLSSLM